jgi:hypothetical protein
MSLREQFIQASIAHFEGHIQKHKVNVELLLSNATGVAEHPDIMETIEKELAIIAEYDDKLSVLRKYFS